MIAVYNQTFLNDILKQNNSVEIFEYSIISDFKSTTTSDTLLKLIQSVIEDEKEGKIELEHKPLECIWEKDTNILNTFIDFREESKIINDCEGIFVYYQLLGNPYTKNIAFTLLDSSEIEIIGSESRVKNKIHLCQTRNLFKIIFPEIVNAELYCYVSNSDIKFLEGPGIEFGENLYTVVEGNSSQLVSKESYIKYIREHNLALPNKSAIKWLDENGMFGQNNIRFRNYVSVNYQIGNLDFNNYAIPTLSGLSKNGGSIQIFGYANYIDYEIDSITKNIKQVGEGIESISSIPSIKIVCKKTVDGFNYSIDNLTQTITYNRTNLNLNPFGIFELSIEYYNPIDKEKIEITSGEFRLLQADSEGGWYVSEMNTGFYENNIPVYLIGNRKDDSTFFEITTTLSDAELENRKIVVKPIEGSKETFEKTFNITTNVISSSKVRKINVEIKAKKENSKKIWAPYIIGTDNTKIDYVEISEKTWDIYRTGDIMIGLDMNEENIITSITKSIDGLEKYLNSLKNTEKIGDWNKFKEDYYPRILKNYLDIDWDLYQTDNSFFAINTETKDITSITQKLALQENCGASLQNLNEILGNLRIGKTTYSLYPGTEQGELEEEARLDKVTEGYGAFGWNNCLNNLYINTKVYSELVIKFKSPLLDDIELWIGNEYFGSDFSGKKYIIEKDKSEVRISIVSDSKLFESINTIYFKTPECNANSENNKSFSVQISNVYFYYPGNQYGLGEKKLYLDLSKIESIYNTKYSKLENKGNTVSYIFDITGETTGLSEEITNLGDQSLLYLVEISCNDYKTKFHAVQIGKTKTLRAELFNDDWKELTVYDNTVKNSFEYDTEELVKSFIIVSNDENDDLTEENSWTIINNPNENIIVNKESGLLGYNPYNNSADIDKSFYITVYSDADKFYGIKKYQSIIFCRINEGEIITSNNWRDLIDRGLYFLNISKKGTTQVIETINTLTVTGINSYGITIRSNCQFCIDVSNITTTDYDIFGNIITGVNCFRVGDVYGNYLDDEGLYYSTFEDTSSESEYYETQVWLYLNKLKFIDSGSWGTIRIFPQNKQDTFNDIFIEVLANIQPDRLNPDPSLGGMLAAMPESGIRYNYDSRFPYYNIFLGNTNTYVEFYCRDSYHPRELITILNPSDSYYGNVNQGILTDLEPYYSNLSVFSGYGHHTSRYTQLDCIQEYPLHYPRFEYKLFDGLNNDSEIIFYIWGKGKPLLINNNVSGRTVIYLYGTKEAYREFTLSYPIDNTGYREFSYRSSNANFSYNIQTKTGDSSKKILTVSTNKDIYGFIGKIYLTFSLTKKGAIIDQEVKDVEQYVPSATHIIEIYHKTAQEEGMPVVQQGFDGSFNGKEFSFTGGSYTIGAIWLPEDAEKTRDCSVVDIGGDYTFEHSSKELTIKVPRRNLAYSSELFYQTYNLYSKYYYGTATYTGRAVMLIETEPGVMYQAYYEDFTITQEGYDHCIMFKDFSVSSISGEYSYAKVFFGRNKTNTAKIRVEPEGATISCILASMHLVSDRTIRLGQSYVEIPKINCPSNIICTIESKSLNTLDISDCNCTIVIPPNTSRLGNTTYILTFTDNENSFYLEIEQPRINDSLELLNVLDGVGTDNLPYLSNGIFIGGTTIRELDFKTTVAQNELTVWYSDGITEEMIDSRYIVLTGSDDNYFNYKLTYIIPENKTDSKRTGTISFKRLIIVSDQFEYSLIKQYTFNQGYYCFKLNNNKYDGDYLGSENSASDYQVLSYGQGINTPWNSRVKFTQSLVLCEVNINTGNLTTPIDCTGEFNLSTGYTGLQKIATADWYLKIGSGLNGSITSLSLKNTRIVWGEEIYEDDLEKRGEYPFIENIYQPSSEKDIKTALNIVIYLVVTANYPVNPNIIFSEDTNINNVINGFLSRESLNYSYKIYLHKPAGSIPAFSTSQPQLSMSGNGEINDEITTTLAPSSLGDIDISLIKYTATSNTEWLSVELIKQDSYVNNVKITAAENNSGTERIGEITIKINSPFVAESTGKTITITQAAKD